MSNVVICHPSYPVACPLAALAIQEADRRTTEQHVVAQDIVTLGLFVCRTSAVAGVERVEVTSLTLAGAVLAFARESGYADHEVAISQWSPDVWNVITPAGRVLGVVLGETA